MRKIAPYLAILLCASAAYGAILVNGAGFTGLDDVAAGTLQCCDFRPILSETYLLNRHVGGWMLTNFGLHLLAGFSIWWLSGSLWASCLFVAHPMAADAVASVAGRSAILSSLLVLLAVATWRKSWLATIALGLATLDALGRVPSRIWTVTGAPEHVRYMADYFSAITTYIVPRLFIPLHFSADPDIRFNPHAGLIGVTILALLISLAMYPNRARLGAALIALSLIPYLAVPLPDVFLEHRAYLALAGATVLMAEFLPKPVLFIALGAFIAFSAFRAQIYSSPLKLWDDAAVQAPTKFRPHLNAGVVHYLYRDLPAAERELQIAVKLNPVDYARQDLLAVYVAENKIKEASGLLAAYSPKGY